MPKRKADPPEGSDWPLFRMEGTFRAQDIDDAFRVLALTYADLYTVGSNAETPADWQMTVERAQP